MSALNLDQGSTEWHAARAGVITASMFKTARDRKKNGDYSAAALDYATACAVERISGEPIDGGFVTWQMKRGTELEAEARAAHSLVCDHDVVEVGFWLSECGRFGGSADGFIGDDGGAEYKCPIGASQLRKLLIDFDISDYVDQCQGAMWLTDRNWWELVIYVPMLDAIGRDVIVHRIERDDDYIAALEADLLEFDALVESFKKKIEAGA